MDKNIYNLLSYILAAPFVGIYVSIIFAFFAPLEYIQINRGLAASIGILFLGIIPLLDVLIMYKIGYLKDMNATNRKRRNLIYFLAILSYIGSALIFWKLGSHAMFLISLAYVFAPSATAITNRFVKISVHVAGVAGPTTALIYVFGLWLMPLYLLSLLIAYVRLKLKAHNITELLLGFIIPAIVTYLVYLIAW
ncbi:MAG: hypothetical protein PHU12_02360 [Candidatus Aenigmarchaeota archaeon]|nr:hypothetical protein [Candidatus Aenigmarchaeota archaeon]